MAQGCFQVQVRYATSDRTERVCQALQLVGRGRIAPVSGCWAKRMCTAKTSSVQSMIVITSPTSKVLPWNGLIPLQATAPAVACIASAMLSGKARVGRKKLKSRSGATEVCGIEFSQAGKHQKRPWNCAFWDPGIHRLSSEESAAGLCLVLRASCYRENRCWEPVAQCSSFKALPSRCLFAAAMCCNATSRGSKLLGT